MKPALIVFAVAATIWAISVTVYQLDFDKPNFTKVKLMFITATCLWAAVVTI